MANDNGLMATASMTVSQRKSAAFIILRWTTTGTSGKTGKGSLASQNGYQAGIPEHTDSAGGQVTIGVTMERKGIH